MLTPVVLDIPDNENAFIDLKKASEIMYFPQNHDTLLGQITSDNFDFQFAQNIINKNQETYNHIEQGLRKEYLISPNMNGVDTTEISPFLRVDNNFLRKLNTLLLLDARNNFETGDYNKGVDRVLQSLDIVYKLREKNNSTAADYLISSVINNEIIELIEVMNSESGFKKEYAVELQEKLEQIKGESVLTEIIGFEYLTMKNSTKNIYKEAMVEEVEKSRKKILKNMLKSNFYFKPNQTVNLYNEQFTNSLNSDLYKCGFFKRRDSLASDESLLKNIFTENVIGKSLVDISMNSVVGPIYRKYCDEYLDITKLQVMLAINSYKYDNGELPESLEVLQEMGYLIPQVADLELQEIEYYYDTKKYHDLELMVPAKPIIYLYPQQKQEVNVQLKYDGELIATYPDYNENIQGWNVMAYPNGHLINSDDGREYSYLFWEGSPFKKRNWDLSKGFVVKGEDTREFLQQKLEEIGLTPKEYNEFIVYWYPKMKDNKYNLIHFAGKTYTDTASLTIIPTPDSMLRVFMLYKSLDKSIEIQPQQFQKFNREGFTVVEWGGTELK